MHLQINVGAFFIRKIMSNKNNIAWHHENNGCFYDKPKEEEVIVEKCIEVLGWTTSVYDYFNSDIHFKKWFTKEFPDDVDEEGNIENNSATDSEIFEEYCGECDLPFYFQYDSRHDTDAKGHDGFWIVEHKVDNKLNYQQQKLFGMFESLADGEGNGLELVQSDNVSFKKYNGDIDYANEKETESEMYKYLLELNYEWKTIPKHLLNKFVSLTNHHTNEILCLKNKDIGTEVKKWMDKNKD